MSTTNNNTAMAKTAKSNASMQVATTILNTKAAVALVSATAVVIGSGWAYNRWKKSRAENKDSSGSGAWSAPSINDMQINPTNLSITKNDAMLIATNLYSAMAKLGTDEDAVKSQLNKLRTKDDFLLVILTFGLKKNDAHMPPGLIRLVAKKKNLIAWLNGEFKGKERDEIANYFKAVQIPF